MNKKQAQIKLTAILSNQKTVSVAKLSKLLEALKTEQEIEYLKGRLKKNEKTISKMSAEIHKRKGRVG
ncbi:hypothetical protein [Planococcus faecalis]|uniref:Uncharacterized protein n=1 Tax=Planococcus faecalis TaxID=1598147 RepID=A0ABM6IUN8_9BACL|nr:hypothetical protein [Planococcus faecalis]AQU79744.1 hypothetical protein AJGP001_10915 [Planococcus faecalis]OHX52060.1 hypothetical protein BB777_14105 [Planococcus faecalis]